ncbi:MAG TPA: DUF3107 domain-containing protein [Nocardioidaceae bacterium]|nr:DUF3107 domain-containing protein [Nocardioidaceae bacterium]
MEVRIGVQHVNREITLESTESADEVQHKIAGALSGDEPLVVLVDEKGRRVVVPAAKLAYVEIGEETARKVGFGSATA